jgi:nucleoid-associated protein YgaU
VIFEANRDVIRNPDLIYPGQVLTAPKKAEGN